MSYLLIRKNVLPSIVFAVFLGDIWPFICLRLNDHGESLFAIKVETLLYRAERRAERKTNERRRRFRPADRKESASSTSAAFSSRSGPSYSASGQPNRRVFSSSQSLGPCFKISSFLYFTR